MKRPDQVESLGSRCRNEHGRPRTGLNWLPIIEGRARHRTSQSPWALCCYRRNYWWLRRELNSRKDYRQPRAQSQRPIRTSPLFSVALFRSLRLFVHSWHLGSWTSDESFDNINSTLIIFSSAMGCFCRTLRPFISFIPSGRISIPKKSSASRLSGEKI